MLDVFNLCKKSKFCAMMKKKVESNPIDDT